MNDKIKNVDKRIVVIYVIVILLIIIGIAFAIRESSYAFNVNTDVYGIDETAYGNTHFNSANLDLKPILDSDVTTKTNNVIKIDFTIGGSNGNPNDQDIIYDIALTDLDIDCDLLSQYMKWKLVKDGEEISSGNLSNSFDTIIDNRLVLTNTQVDLPDYSSSQSNYDNYSFYLWLSDSCQSSDTSECFNSEDQSNLLGKSISGKIEVELNTGFKKTLTRYPSEGDACSNIQKVLFDPMGGEVNISSKEIVNGEAYGTLPTPTRENYTFDGWHLDEDYTLEVKENSIVNTSGNIILYAKWIPVEYNITYNLSNCTTNDNPSTYNIDTPSFALNNPICPGYTFDGWTGSNGNNPTRNVTISKGSTGDKTYNANITPNVYNITYDLNGSNNYMTPASSSITKNDFTGATNDCFSIGTFNLSGLSENDTVKISFDVTYSNITADTSQGYGIYAQGSGDVTSWSPGISFSTVSSQILGTGTYHYEFTRILSADLISNSYFTMTIRTDYITGGTLTITNIKITKANKIVEEKTYGETLGTLPTVTDAGRPFAGWYTTETGGTQVTENTSVPPEDTTYYALWGTAYKVKIQYSVNGGSWAGSTNSALTADSSGYVTLNGSRDALTLSYGSSTSSDGLSNYNNSSYINISKTGYVGKSGAEWICLSGCTTANKTFNQATVYNSSDFCDASSGDCTVVLGVNWTRNFTCASAGSTTTYAGKSWYTANKDSDYCYLALNSLSSSTGTYANATTNLTNEYFTSGSTLLTEKNAGLVTVQGTYTGTSGISSGIFWSGSSSTNAVAQSFTYYTVSSVGFYYGSLHTTDYKKATGVNLLTSINSNLSQATKTACDSISGSSCVISNGSKTSSTTSEYYSNKNTIYEIKALPKASKAYGSFSMIHHNFPNGNDYTNTQGRLVMYACGGDRHGSYAYTLRGTSDNKLQHKNGYTGNTSKISSGSHFWVLAGVASSNTYSETSGSYTYTRRDYNCSKDSSCETKTVYSTSNATYPIHYRLYIKVKYT